MTVIQRLKNCPLCQALLLRDGAMIRYCSLNRKHFSESFSRYDQVIRRFIVHNYEIEHRFISGQEATMIYDIRTDKYSSPPLYSTTGIVPVNDDLIEYIENFILLS